MESLILTVVIPTYNRQDITLRALTSVLDQGLADIEVVVVDDGSQPEFVLPAVVADDRRVRLVRHGANRGAAAARNTGLARAHGRWAAFLDSDDRWLPGTLAPRLAEFGPDRFWLGLLDFGGLDSAIPPRAGHAAHRGPRRNAATLRR
jgi:glycosyltransferase involved in cell wall biosynthesis